MKITMYIRMEKAISAGSVADIRQRWMWGLRVLRDAEMMSESGKSLKHGVTEQLIAAAKAAGLKLSATEIRARLQCARAYPTEGQISRSTADFEYWSTLVHANFPAYDADPDERPADHRTDRERAQDRNRAMAALNSDDDALFPLHIFRADRDDAQGPPDLHGGAGGHDGPIRCSR